MMLTEPMRGFMASVKKEMPSFPADSHVYLTALPASYGRMEQVLRILYRRDDIHIIRSLDNYSRRADENAFIIYCSSDSNFAIIPMTEIPAEVLEKR